MANDFVIVVTDLIPKQASYVLHVGHSAFYASQTGQDPGKEDMNFEDFMKSKGIGVPGLLGISIGIAVFPGIVMVTIYYILKSRRRNESKDNGEVGECHLCIVCTCSKANNN